ncbi:TPA: hypothetical protein ACXN4B_003806, partial [Pseudomonas aeruginosa]
RLDLARAPGRERLPGKGIWGEG